MTHENYSRYCLDHAAELEDELASYEDHGLKEKLAQFSLSEWLDWQADHASEIAAYVASPPAKRQRLKKWRKLQPYLTFAALQHVHAADYMLSAIDQDLYLGQSYRSMFAEAGSLYYRVSSGLDCPDLVPMRKTSRDLLSKFMHCFKSDTPNKGREGDKQS